MVDIAEAASVSKPLLYHYFSTKQDLYVAAVRSAAEELRRATRPDESVPAGQEVQWSLEAHIDWIDANALAYRTVLQGGMSGDPDVQAIIEQSRHEVVDRIVRSLGREQPSALLRVALRGWVGFLEGVCIEWLRTRGIAKPELVRLLATSLRGTITSAQR